MDNDSTFKLHTGRPIPVMGLGTWQLTNDTSGTVTYALELGYPMIDTSSDYGTQPGIGNALNKDDIDRDSIYIVTKVEETDDAYQATQAYLAEMDLKYADLMLIHRPPENGAGEELWKGLIKARDDGLTRDIGVSNYPSNLIDQLIKETGETPVINQIEWSPFGHSHEFKQYCDKNNILIMAYSPLTRATKLGDDTLNQIAQKYSKTPAQILIRWNLQLGTIPIPKATQIDHLEENIDVFDFELDQDDIDQLHELNQHYSSLGSLPYV